MKNLNNALSDLLQEKGILLADGATGSNLFSAGLQTGDSPELWNDIHPDRIANQYDSFIEAGSDIILTNTFGGTKYRLGLHGAANRVTELNIKSAKIARERVEKVERTVLVAGSMGPTGEILEPLGKLTQQQAAEAFEEQAWALKEGSVDVLWIETMSSKEEVEAAVIGASKVGLPVVATFSIDTNGRTMMGLTPADIVKLSIEMENVPFAIGSNCGIGASELVASIVNMRHALHEQGVEIIVIAKANCGIPEYVDGEIVYSGTAEIMAEYVRMSVDAGAQIIGGCCGTTPHHLSEMRKALDDHIKRPVPNLEIIERHLGDVSRGAKAQLKGDLSIAAGALRETVKRRSRRRLN